MKDKNRNHIRHTAPVVRVLWLTVMALWLHAAPLKAQEGSSAYNFLDIPGSAQSFGLGGAAIALVDADVMLSDQNPALLGPEIGSQVALSYMHWLGSANFAGARYGMEAGERGAWAAGIRYLGYGSMTAYEPDGSVSGSFTPQDIVAEGTYSHDFNDRLRGGINLKMAYSNYEQYTAFAMAVDLGINYYNPDNDLSFSVVLRNMGGQLKRFNDTYDRLPFDVQLGYMQGLGSSPFSLAITARHLTKWNLTSYHHEQGAEEDMQPKSGFMRNLFRHLVFGLQYRPTDRFYISLGYDYKMRTDMSTYQRNFLCGFSAGLGLNVRNFGIGVAYAMPHKGGSSVMLNLSMDLSSLL